MRSGLHHLKESTEATGDADGSPTLLVLMNKTVKAVTGHLTARHHRPKKKFTLSTATWEKCQGIRALARLDSKNQKMWVKRAERTRQKLPSSPKNAFWGGWWGRWAILLLKNFAIWNKLLFSGVCCYPEKYNRTPGLMSTLRTTQCLSKWKRQWRRPRSSHNSRAHFTFHSSLIFSLVLSSLGIREHLALNLGCLHKLPRQKVRFTAFFPQWGRGRPWILPFWLANDS